MIFDLIGIIVIVSLKKCECDLVIIFNDCKLFYDDIIELLLEVWYIEIEIEWIWKFYV